jgi:hypothetical protein
MLRLITALACLLLLVQTANAQVDHSAHQHGATPTTSATEDHSQMDHSAHMKGMLGKYPMSRESSGTAWQPQSTPMEGKHFMSGDWMLMLHGFADFIYDSAGGDRGSDKLISANMLMLMARRDVGKGALGLRGMFSLEPATIGTTGYPLLLQTGETADGREHLIDRQHPHDLFMELAASYSYPVGENDSLFVYLGLPGEPALGPPTFMHRFSGMDNPEAPITHHWLDSTHITFGVTTVGFTFWNSGFKLEGSLFTGREPDQDRWDIETPKMDSQSVRLTFNPDAKWSLQASYGHINSPEQLEPDVDVNRTTLSISHHARWGRDNHWAATIAWGRNNNEPGHTLDAFLFESAWRIEQVHTIFTRFENAAKDELFDEDEPQAGEIFHVSKLSVGYIYEMARWKDLKFGLGAVGSLHFIPDDLDDVYGDDPASFMLFARVKL